MTESMMENKIIMKIKVYTLSTCPHCKKAKKFLKEHRIKFENIEVDNNEKAIKEMYKKSKQYGVPVIDIDGKIVVGFNEEKLRKIFHIK